MNFTKLSISRSVKIAALLAVLGGVSAVSRAGISSWDIALKSLSCTDCMHWKLIGECNWVKCGFLECHPEVSPMVGHYIPDLAIASYSGKMPIDDLSSFGIGDDNPATMSQQNRPGDTQVDYKHVRIFGNPAVATYAALGQVGLMCQSTVKVPWLLYFDSAADPLWYSPLSIEGLFPQALIGYPYIKAQLPLAKWANVYPRCGWGTHPYDAINAAVAAHRAAEIVTRTGQFHLYVPPSSDCGNRCWAPPEVEAGNTDTHKFQMLYPVEDHSGYAFGGSATWADGRNVDSKEGYVFALWRPYKCCRKAGDFYIGRFQWDTYP